MNYDQFHNIALLVDILTHNFALTLEDVKTCIRISKTRLKDEQITHTNR